MDWSTINWPFSSFFSGGLPKEVIIEVAKEIYKAHESIFELTVDRKLLDEFLTYIQKNQAMQAEKNAKVKSTPAPTPNKRRRTRALDDSDEEPVDEEEGDDEGKAASDVEEEKDEISGTVTETTQDDAEEDSLRTQWAKPDFVEVRRQEIAATMNSDREARLRAMDRVFDTVRNKRGGKEFTVSVFVW